jgi:hypothetical protein
MQFLQINPAQGTAKEVGLRKLKASLADKIPSGECLQYFTHLCTIFIVKYKGYA